MAKALMRELLRLSKAKYMVKGSNRAGVSKDGEKCIQQTIWQDEVHTSVSAGISSVISSR